jgi:hypothetical protein
MNVTTVACDVCGRQKQETNHWLLVISRPDVEGLIFQPAGTEEEPRRERTTYEDVCSDGCAQKRLQRYLDELKKFTAAPTAETEAA